MNQIILSRNARVRTRVFIPNPATLCLPRITQNHVCIMKFTLIYNIRTSENIVIHGFV